MKIEQALLIPNEYSRPQRQLQSVKAVVMHYTQNAGASAKVNRDFFNNRRTGLAGYGSAHYIVGIDGEVLQCIPESEVAYHCGTSKPDPVSKHVYTDDARYRFGAFASSASSPNNCTIGVELCNIDELGNFTDATIKAAVELVADILKRYDLTPDDIVRHFDVVGWKECPLLWVREPALFDAFKASVADKMARG